jgi:hypothetical protein
MAIYISHNDENLSSSGSTTIGSDVKKPLTLPGPKDLKQLQGTLVTDVMFVKIYCDNIEECPLHAHEQDLMQCERQRFLRMLV